MDATTSFAYLTDNLPKWIGQVKDLSAYASKRHGEYVAEYNRRLSSTRPKKPRTASLESCRPNEDEELLPTSQPVELPSQPSSGPSPVNPFHIPPLEAGNKYLFAEAQRKRKLGPSVHSGASGPQKFRSKHMIVIYYDGYIQEQLDTLVKSIGGGRNNLRKGKLSRSAVRGFQLPSHRRVPNYASYLASASTGQKTTPSPSPTSPLSDPKIQLAGPTPTGDEAFAQTDKYLEAAQNLCETASHQVLRDGNCYIELASVVTKLETVLELATVTVAQLRAEDAQHKEQEGDPKHTDSAMLLTADPSRPPSLTHSSNLTLVPSLSEKKEFSPPSVHITSGGVTEIEVDDNSDQESIVVDITQFRTARMTRSQCPGT